MTTVLLLEGARPYTPSFAPQLDKRYTLLVAHTSKSAISLARNRKPDIIIVDAASMRTSGNRICQAIRGAANSIPIIHIKEKPPQSKEQSSANTVIYLPFTHRKLCNRIERYIQANPGEILKAGDFSLNVPQSVLTTPGGEKKLTPKLAKLIEIFMRQPGQVIERLTLMKQVWQTDYMGDTRTLDVHIRWIREIIEQNPNKPIFLKTVRGKGYMLDVPR